MTRKTWTAAPMRPLNALAALALVSCQPALAATYGPPAPVAEVPRSLAERETFEIGPEETLEAAEARIHRDTGNAWRKFWIGQGLVVTDIALTCAILAKGGREANPIYGKGANCGRIAAIRGSISALQYLLARKSIAQDPRRASRSFNITLAFQGVPLVWNAVQLAK